ncbi:uncharacterized protein LOC128988173 [Macrosteles quadrilineatus]|uniref:uncharacterized protein LOC128988173 n=1 Tax=Macrosteles quadrilineatus TaxID=74068 RepID=UPI0023E162B6|nr:uncharacterized protein LOC128988173 [Macrosteles quadrilineatus]
MQFLDFKIFHSTCCKDFGKKMRVAPTLKYCCCGISLKLGTLLIGIIALLGSIGSFASAFDFYLDVQEAIENPEIEDPHFVKIREHLLAVQVYMYASFVLTFLGTILAVLLMTGYFIRNKTLLKSWVVGIIIMQVIDVGSNIAMCVLYSHCLFMLFNITAIVNLYFACVVNSYAEEINKGSLSSIA